jgi:hypothetical protein
VTFQQLWGLVPGALAEMKDEFFRRASECFDENARSQRTACFMLALRALSLLNGMIEVLKPDRFDSYDVLLRAFLESRDLLTTFRFDDPETKSRVERWFKDKAKDTWVPQHNVCERFLKNAGAGDLELARKWGAFSELSHPKFVAAQNSVAVVSATISLENKRLLIPVLSEKQADFISSMVSLYVSVSFDFPGWVELGCDPARLIAVEEIKTMGPALVYPLLDRINKRNNK